ncbi:MAG: multi-sensor signal transduction histidine kinase [Candidatus Eremiobacteraeota bacterium]|nr:multi-sensor signal transduction histidine kinase [Candidatus Eremiobacteraeota bacterium]
MTSNDDELARIEHALAASEARYRRLAEAMPQLVWTLDRDGTLDFVNEHWVAYTGLSFEESAGEERARALHPDDRVEMAQRWREAAVSHEAFELQSRIRRAADGAYRWFHLRAAPAFEADGTPAGWVATAIDIEDRVRAETTLAFLANVSDVLAQAVDEQRLFEEVAHLASRTIADWFAVYLREGGAVRVAALAHADPVLLARGVDAARRYPVRADDPIVRIIESGHSVLMPHVDPEAVRAAAHDERHLALTAQFDLASAMVVPLVVRDERVGALLLVRGSETAPYSQSDLRVAEVLAKRVALGYENVRQYRRQQRVADSFQRAALPKSLPRMDGLVLDALYAAASDELSVGGDWYDAFPLPDGRLAITVGDVAGKGLDAAVLMATVRQSIRVAALQGLEPSAILAAAEAALDLEYNDRLVTAFVALVDPRSWTVAYASAGHPPALVRRPDGTLLSLEGAGLPLGAPVDAGRKTRQLIGIPPGSLLVLYTDGLVESTRDVIEGEARLRAALTHDAVLHSNSPAKLIHDLVIAERALDDVAILTLALGRETHWAFESADALAAQSVRSSFVAALAREASADSDLGAAELIFGELIGNVVRYAPGAIDIDLEWIGAVPVLHVLDRGGGFDLRSTLPEDVMSERGRGLYIVSVLGTDLRADRLPGRGNHVRVVLPVRRRQV